MSVTLTFTTNVVATGPKSVQIEITAPDNDLTAAGPLGVVFRLISMTGFLENDPIKALPVWDMGAGQYSLLDVLNHPRVPADAKFFRKNRGVYYGFMCGHTFWHADGAAAPTLSIRDTDGSMFTIPFNQWRDEADTLIGPEISPADPIAYYSTSPRRILCYSKTGDFTGAPAAGGRVSHQLFDGTQYDGTDDPGVINAFNLEDGPKGGSNPRMDQESDFMLMFEGGEEFYLQGSSFKPRSNCHFTSFGTGRATLNQWDYNPSGSSMLEIQNNVNGTKIYDIDLYCSPLDTTDYDNSVVNWWNRLNFDGGTASGYFTGRTGVYNGFTDGETITGGTSGATATLVGDNHPAFTGSNEGTATSSSTSGTIQAGRLVTNGSGGEARMCSAVGGSGQVVRLNEIRGRISNGDTLTGTGGSFTITGIPGGFADEDDNYLAVGNITGTFANGETLTGGTSGTTATYIAAGSVTDRQVKSSIPFGLSIDGQSSADNGWFLLANCNIQGANQSVGQIMPNGSVLENVGMFDFWNYGPYCELFSKFAMVGCFIAQNPNGTKTGPYATGSGAVANNRNTPFTCYAEDNRNGSRFSFPNMNLQVHTAIRLSQTHAHSMHYCMADQPFGGGHGAADQPLYRGWVKGEGNLNSEPNRPDLDDRRSACLVHNVWRGGQQLLLCAGPTNASSGFGSFISTPKGVLFFGNHVLYSETNSGGTLSTNLPNVYVWGNLLERTSGTTYENGIAKVVNFAETGDDRNYTIENLVGTIEPGVEFNVTNVSENVGGRMRSDAQITSNGTYNFHYWGRIKGDAALSDGNGNSFTISSGEALRTTDYYYRTENEAPCEFIGNTYIDQGSVTTVNAWADPDYGNAYRLTPVIQDNIRAINPANFSGTITDNESVSDLDPTTFTVTASANGYQAATGGVLGMKYDRDGSFRGGNPSRGYLEP
jgi:hypothetical protein